MTCYKCNASLSEGAKFCSACGTPTVEAALFEPMQRPPQATPDSPPVFDGSYWVNAHLPDNVQSTLPPGWFVQLVRCRVNVLQLKVNGAYDIQIHELDGVVKRLATRVPLQDWHNTGIQFGVVVVLADPKLPGNGTPIGFFDVQNGTYSHLQEDIWCRQAFDAIGGVERKPKGFGGLAARLAGVGDSAGLIMSNSTLESHAIRSVFQGFAQSGGVFSRIRNEFFNNGNARL